MTIGEEVGLTILVSNPGSGAADNVVLQAKIPASLRHPAGADLEYEVGVLKPKESRQLELKLIAVEAGTINLPLIARAEANLTADGRFDMEVIAPRLEVALEGPKRRFLEREATYTLSVSNPGTAPARQVLTRLSVTSPPVSAISLTPTTPGNTRRPRARSTGCWKNFPFARRARSS